MSEANLSKGNKGGEKDKVEGVELRTKSSEPSTSGSKESHQDTCCSSNDELVKHSCNSEAHEEDTAGCFCPVQFTIPHFHWSKKKPRVLAGDQFAYDIWHKPREELDESPGHGRRGRIDCGKLCTCGAWRWWPGWSGN